MTNEFNPDWLCVCGDLTILNVVHRKDGPCYHPKEWQDLTDEQILAEVKRIDPDEQYLPKALAQLARAILAAAKEKNT